MAHILVTGSAGFIGSHLVRELLDAGHRVHGVDSFITGKRAHAESLLENSRFLFSQMDITDPHFIDHFTNDRFDSIYHIACPTGVPNLRTLAEEMLTTCSYGMFNVMSLARAHGSRVVFTSTAEVYGQPEVFPQHEGYNGNVSTLGERSPYEEGKRFSESVLAMYVRKYGVDARVARVFNTYGPNMSLEDRRVIPQFFKSITTQTPLVIYGDGSQTRCHLYVDDLVRGLQTIMEHGKSGEAYNVGSERQMTVRELADLVIDITGHDAGISYKPHFIEDHRHRKPATEKLRNLGWSQTISIEEGLARMAAIHVPQVTTSEAADDIATIVATPAIA